MSWLYYLLEANLYLISFFAFYYLVLRRETWYQYNRAYLLVASALAFVIPFLQLGMLKPTPLAPAGQLGITQISFAPVDMTNAVVTNTSWTKEDYYLAGYLLIACCLLVNLAAKIYKLVKLSRLNAYKKADKWKIIETDENKGAFSFFNYLFVSPQMALSETVIAHELVHIRQKHSWDIVYFEIIKVVSWFNPIAYLLQNSIKELHEFIADSEIAGDGNTINQYTDFLLGNAYGIHENQLTNNLFNKSLLKKRIMMLHQKKSGNSARLKYLLVLPLSAGLLCASTLAFAKTYGWIDLAPKHEPGTKIIRNRTSTTIPTDKKATRVTSKGYKYEETGYVIDHKSNFRVIIYEKNGDQKSYFKNSATPAELKLLKDKYGYTFPNMEIFDRMPPPPPAPMQHIAPPPPPAPPQQKQQSSNKLPPPGFSKPGFNTLAIYLAKYIRYPAKEHDQKIVGNVVIELTINSEHKTTNIKVMDDARPAFADEVVRAAKLYTDTVNSAPGTYILGIQFNVVNEKMTKSYLPAELSPGLQNNSNFAGIVELVTFLKD